MTKQSIDLINNNSSLSHNHFCRIQGYRNKSLNAKQEVAGDQDQRACAERRLRRWPVRLAGGDSRTTDRTAIKEKAAATLTRYRIDYEQP